MTLKQIEGLVDQELRFGTQRSAEYRRGAIELLCRKEMSTALAVPYSLGTAQADAWFSGTDRGWMIWHKLHDDCEAAAGQAVAQ